MSTSPINAFATNCSSYCIQQRVHPDQGTSEPTNRIQEVAVAAIERSPPAKTDCFSPSDLQCMREFGTKATESIKDSNDNPLLPAAMIGASTSGSVERTSSNRSLAEERADYSAFAAKVRDWESEDTENSKIGSHLLNFYLHDASSASIARKVFKFIKKPFRTPEYYLIYQLLEKYQHSSSTFEKEIIKWALEHTPSVEYFFAAEDVLNCYRLAADSLVLTDVKSLPPGLDRLNHLKSLEIIRMDLSVANWDSLTALKQLTELKIVKCELTDAPAAIGQLTHLEVLSISGTQIQALPPEIGNLRNLKTLSLNSNALKTLPPEIGQLTQLKIVKLKNNFLSTLPEEFKELASLERLYLNKNHLDAIPSFLDRLGRLKVLSVFNCGLTELSSEIGTLTDLEELNLSFNNLTTLPHEMGQLIRLRKLDLSNNQLTTVPNLFLQLTSLRVLCLEDNPIASIPQRLFDLPQLTVFENRMLRDQVDLYQEGHHSADSSSLQMLWAEVVQAAGEEVVELEHLKDNTHLQSWLSRLEKIGDYKTKRKELASLIYSAIKRAEQDKSFREVFLSCIAGASATCGDRMALSLLLVDVRYQIDIALKNNDIPRLAFLLGHGSWALDELEKIARNKIENLKMEEKHVDEIEVFLGYPIMLKDALSLPFTLDSMLYGAMSHITEENLRDAQTIVKSFLSEPDSYSAFLVEQAVWQEALKAQKPEEYNKIEEARSKSAEALPETATPNDYILIEKEYKLALRDLTKKVLLEECDLPFLKQ